MSEVAEPLRCLNYVTYSGVKLPLKLVSPLGDECVDGRITYFRGYYDSADLLVKVEKVVYGEIEFTHEYGYYNDGRIQSVLMREGDDEPRRMTFD